MDTEVITEKQWELCARRIEKKNLRERKISLTFVSIMNRTKSFILELYPDNKTMVVRKGWREAMRKAGEE